MTVKTFLSALLCAIFMLWGCGTEKQGEDLDTGDGVDLSKDTDEPRPVDTSDEVDTSDLVDTGLPLGYFECGDLSDPCCVDDTMECWKDPATGLVWDKLNHEGHWMEHGPDQDLKYPFDEYNTAAEFCDELILGGFTDWRIPTIDELKSVVRHCHQFTDECDVNDPKCNGVSAKPGQECLVDRECNCFDFERCMDTGHSSFECFDRPWSACYLPDEISLSCNTHGSNYEVWSQSNAWQCEGSVGFAGDPPPYCESVIKEDSGDVWVLDFNTAMPYTRRDQFVFHPVYPPVPAMTWCVRGGTCDPKCGENQECATDGVSAECVCLEGYVSDGDGGCSPEVPN